MAKFEVTAPDGAKYEIEAPDNATQDQILAFAQSEFSKEKPKPSALERFGKGMVDPIEGGAQLLYEMAPQGIRDPVNRLNNLIAEKTGLVAPIGPQGLSADIKQREKDYQTAKGEGFDFARLGGNILNPANLAIASRLPILSSLFQKTAQGAAIGAGTGLLNPVYGEGDFAQEKGKQALAGGIGGAIAPAVVQGISRVVKPQPSAEVGLLQSEGITPTIGSRFGGWAQSLESKAESIPGLGDVIKNAKGKTIDEINRAAYNRALSPIGEKSTAEVGSNGVAEVHSKLSNAYKGLLEQVQFKPDQEFATGLNNLRKMVGGLPKDVSRLYDNITTRLFSRATPQGNMTGETLKGVESSLGEEIALLRGRGGYEHGKVADALEEVQSLLRESLARQNPGQAEALKKINEGWANYAIIRDAASMRGAKDNKFTPAQLGSSVYSNAQRRSGRPAGKGKLSEGRALMQDLSTAGEKVLGGYPDSGTAGRAMIGGAAAGGLAYVNPAYLAGAAAGTLPYLPGGRQLVNALTTSRPKFASPLAEALRNYSPLAAPAFLPAGQSILEAGK